MVTQWFHRTEEYPVFFFVQLSDPVDSVRGPRSTIDPLLSTGSTVGYSIRTPVGAF